MSTSTLTKASEDAERLASMFSGLAGLSEELKRVGSLQQAGNEAKARLDALAAEHERRDAEHQKQLAEQQVVAKRELDRLSALTGGIKKQLDDARAVAADIVAKGQAQADLLTAQARANIAKEIDAGAGRVTAAEAERQSIMKGIDDLRAQRAAEAEDLRDMKKAASDEARKLATAAAEFERLKSLFQAATRN